jgi:hypothetical protein
MKVNGKKRQKQIDRAKKLMPLQEKLLARVLEKRSKADIENQ